MPRHVMRPGASPLTWVIRTGRRTVGSVRPSESGAMFVGRIAQHTACSVDPVIAFREVAAVARGFANLAALRAHNRTVRERNLALRPARRRRTTFHNTLSCAQPIPDEPFSG